jgi:hypothetical protein
MSIIEWFTLAGIAISSVLSLFSIMSIAYLAGVKITRVETQVEGLKDDTRELSASLKNISEFLFRRGTAEAVINGKATINSPIKISDEAEMIFQDLKPDLKKMGQANPGMTDVELAFLIERKWGDFIMKNICIPHKMTQGACLVFAVELARGNRD